MVPIISVIGRKKAGKTTLLERLIVGLKRRGYNVATIKHHIHYGFSMDSPGKDTWRHSSAGADIVAISSPDTLVLTRKTRGELLLREIVEKYMHEVDVVLTEGYARAETPKILVAGGREDMELFSSAARGEIACVVSNSKLEAEVKVFGFEEVEKLVDFVEERFIHAEHSAH